MVHSTRYDFSSSIFLSSLLPMRVGEQGQRKFGGGCSPAGTRALSPDQWLHYIWKFSFLLSLSYRYSELRSKEKYCQAQTKPEPLWGMSGTRRERGAVDFLPPGSSSPCPQINGTPWRRGYSPGRGRNSLRNTCALELGACSASASPLLSFAQL